MNYVCANIDYLIKSDILSTTALRFWRVIIRLNIIIIITHIVLLVSLQVNNVVKSIHWDDVRDL